MDPQGIRLRPSYGLGLHLIGAGLVLSGAVAAAVDLAQLAGWDTDTFLTARVWALKVHGAAAMFFMIALGALLPTHIRRAWLVRRNLRGGGVLVAVLLGLIVTGYGLYYLGGEVSRSVVLWTHVGLGFAEPPLLILHIFLGRRTRPITC